MHILIDRYFQGIFVDRFLMIISVHITDTEEPNLTSVALKNSNISDGGMA
jgi:hypothetical protein